MDRSEIDRWSAAAAQEQGASVPHDRAEIDALRAYLRQAMTERDALASAARGAVRALESGQILDWSVRDRVVSTLRTALGDM